MPEIKCWNGATLTTVANYTVVDQCYCSTSTNAQSGVAVAQIAALRNSTICIATPTSTAIADSTLLLSGANGSNPASLASYPATSISAYVWSKICGCTIANATCFGGCTYACAKADIRNYTPTAVSGTVTLTAPTAVGKSTCITSAATTDGFDIYGCWRSADNYDLILNLRDDGTNYVGFACNGTVKSYVCASNGYFYGNVCGSLCGTATNATCFGGCTYAQACSNIRSGLTSCTGTVTSVNVSVNGVSGTAVTGSGTVTLSNVPPYFANNTLYTVGDDVKIGDVNVAGKLGIQGATADTPGFVLRNRSGTVLGCLYATGSTLCWTGSICAATAVYAPTICGTTVVRAPTFATSCTGVSITNCDCGPQPPSAYAVQIGQSTAASCSVAIGSAQAMGQAAIAVGPLTYACGASSIAIGVFARALNSSSIAIGGGALATDYRIYHKVIGNAVAEAVFVFPKGTMQCVIFNWLACCGERYSPMWPAVSACYCGQWRVGATWTWHNCGCSEYGRSLVWDGDSDIDFANTWLGSDHAIYCGCTATIAQRVFVHAIWETDYC